MTDNDFGPETKEANRGRAKEGQEQIETMANKEKEHDDHVLRGLADQPLSLKRILYQNLFANLFLAPRLGEIEKCFLVMDR